MRRSAVRAVVVALTILPAAADDGREARRHWLHGRYDEAIALYEKLATDSASSVAAAVGIARCHAARGNVDAATKVLEAAAANHPGAANIASELAALALSAGQLERAAEFANRALAAEPDNLPARWTLTQVADQRGDFADSTERLGWFIRYFNAHDIKDAETLVWIARAATEHARRTRRGREQSEQLRFVLNDLLDAALAADADYWPARLESGLLFLEKYKKGDAARDLEAARAINSDAAEVHYALALAAHQEYNLEKGHEHCDRALRLNPRFGPAALLKAELFMARDQFAEARQQLAWARQVNPIDEATLAALTACHWIAREPEEVARITQEVTMRNPRPAAYFLALAKHLENHRQFDDADKHFNQALELAPHLTAARTGLGMMFMRIGREAEAEKLLSEAFEADPFSVRIKNMLEVLDQLKGYRTIETPHFRVKVDDQFDGILGRCAATYLEEVYAELSRRFAYEVSEPIQIEIFNKGRGQSAHEWFSARTIGLPWIGTVGACTGKVVAMASPRGVDKPFNWARVLKHEVAHVITLQQTRFNIPHWFTEALAVECEAYPRPEVWDQLLAERAATDNLLNLDNINQAFVRPKSPLDWQMAYCQSELYVDYMRTRFGEDRPAKLLAAYREGMLTPQAVQTVFAIEPKQFEAGYREYVKELAGTLRLGPVDAPQPLAELEQLHAARPDDPDLAARLAFELLKRRSLPRARDLARKAIAAKPNHPLGSFVLARLYLSVRETDRAVEVLRSALDRAAPDPRVLELLADLQVRAKQYPVAEQLYELGKLTYPNDSRWAAGLARVYVLTNQNEKLISILELLSTLDADDLAPRRKLLNLAVAASDWDRVARLGWLVLHIDAYDVSAHAALGDAYAAQKRGEQAIAEYRIALELNPKSTEIRVRLARVFQELGRREDLAKEIESILLAEPDNEAAKKLRGGKP